MNLLYKILIICFVFFSFVNVSFASTDAKIAGLIFDDADSVMFVDMQDTENVSVVEKGYLKNPDRIYVDIKNAILTTPKKNYDGKNSVFNSVKISQFSTDPNVVRIVFEYSSNFDLSKFEILKNDIITIKTSPKIVQNKDFKNVWTNSRANERTTYYKGASFYQKISSTESEITPESKLFEDLDKKEKVNNTKINSNYYVESISKTKDGILIQGIGNISLIPSFVLENPARLVIDLDDSTLNKELWNKTFTIGDANLVEGEIEKREVLKIAQNAQSIVRAVIQGENAKDYRAIISPYRESLFITKKTDIINSKIAEFNAKIISSSYQKSKDTEKIGIKFDDSVALSVFEENSNLYIDLLNLDTTDISGLDELLKSKDVKTIKIALDKLRLVIQENNDTDEIENFIAVKLNSSSDEMNIIFKETKKEKKEEKKGVSFVPTVISKKNAPEISNLYTVVIDSGHGGSDVGATRNNIYEKDITLKIAKMVEKNLKDKKVKTYMTRDKDKTVSLSERSEFSNEIKPDVFVSIHVNSSVNDSIYGVETHYWKEDSVKYAKTVHKQMQKYVKDWKTIDRGLFKSQFYVINHTDSPAILCEIGFISNSNERGEITKTKRQEEIARAISDGIYEYLKSKK